VIGIAASQLNMSFDYLAYLMRTNAFSDVHPNNGRLSLANNNRRSVSLINMRFTDSWTYKGLKN
jgi:hypothetical protein